MHAAPILQYLKKHGQKLDSDIAEATGIPIAKVRASITELAERGEISKCSVTRFIDGFFRFPAIGVGTRCRIAEMLGQPGNHLGRHTRVYRRGSGVVEINR